MAERSRVKIPHPMVILFCVIIFMSILSYVLPAGQYVRVEDLNSGRKVVDPTSFQVIESSPVTFMQLFSSIPRGMAAAQEIIFFIIIVSGAFQIITATGAIEGGIGTLALRLRDKDKVMIPLVMGVFSIGGATFGMAEENIIFVPIGIALARALGFDALVGMGMITIGAACGFCSGVLNPFTTGVAQKIAELPIFSGIELRIAVLIAMLLVSSVYVVRYALKVKKDPELSYVRDVELAEVSKKLNLEEINQLTQRQSAVLTTVLIALIYIVYGVFKLGFGMLDIGTLFLMTGIVCGLIGGFGAEKLSKEFLTGVRDISTGAVMVGFARAILVVMQDGSIIDTIVYGLATFVQGLPSSITIIGMYVVQMFVDIFIPSATGQAAATMPIMIPIADVLGINRQVAVLTYQFGDGFTSYILPTSGTLIATLSVARVPYDRWVRFMFPLFLMWVLLGGVFVVFANAINYGPF